VGSSAAAAGSAAYGARKAAAAAGNAEAESRIERALTKELMSLRMSATEYAIWAAKEELKNFEGTGNARVIATEITIAKVEKIMADAAAKEAAAAEQAAAKRRAAMVKDMQERIKAAQQAADAEAKINRQRAQRRAQERQQGLKHDLAGRRDAMRAAEEAAAQAAQREQAARERVLMNPGDIIKTERAERRQMREDSRDNAKVNRLVEQARARQERGGPLSARQRAAQEDRDTASVHYVPDLGV
jgi:hypothetical protein